ncbi:MAG: aspartyl/glutamyl-tRNA amidotransferase subunit A [Betaproteobacteria bacterium TMED156]|nr:MAG: aspartyl/glutamyl-tRNA amidotransferase subunit A [Betaproteobacteria bacterium TMED156]
MTITEIKNLYSKKKLSAIELTKDILKRIEDNPYGATLCINKEASIDQAEKAQMRLEAGENGSLLGIPIMHKDVFVTRDWFTTAGSKILKNYKSPFDAEVVKNLSDKGMVCLGKTSCDEFAMGSANQNCAYGRCSNPWDSKAIPGGSSGGSAAMVAAGVVPASTGTDTGGSIRQPAAMCGVTGLKPTYGRVSRWGLIAYASSLDQAGPIARSAEDCAILLDGMAGFDKKDSTSIGISFESFSECINVPFENTSHQKPLNGIKIGLPSEYFSEGIDIKVENAVRDSIKELEKLGAQIKEISLPATKFAVAAYYVIAPAEASSNLSRFDGVKYGLRSANTKNLNDLYVNTRTEGFGKEVRRRILIGTFVLSHGYYEAYYLKALKVRRLVTLDFENAFENCDLVVGPTSPTVAWNQEESPKFFGKNNDISGVPSEYLSDIYTVGASLGGFPAISIPCGFADFENTKRPIGLQLIAPKLQEKLVLKCAHIFQKNTDWHTFTPLK